MPVPNQEARRNASTPTRRGRAVIEIDGEQLSYELYEFDARTDEQRRIDERRQALEGDLIVIIPGHGQTADSARHLIENSATMGKSKVAWSVDIDPPKGGDPVKARALPLILRRHLPALFASSQAEREPSLPGVAVTLFGWSHGGAEALRTAEVDQQLIRQVAGLCPAGLVERTLGEILLSFLLECLRIFRFALTGRNPRYLGQVLSIGANIAGGVTRDALRTRSLARIVNDIRWAARKVPGRNYRYAGGVALLLGGRDTVIRWRDVFPECESADRIPDSLRDYQRNDFPHVTRLDVRVLDGNHLSPETDAAFARTALEVTSQLGEDGA
jgi:pimeloyl-ACP methyl ester carboxylesterase